MPLSAEMQFREVKEQVWNQEGEATEEVSVLCFVCEMPDPKSQYQNYVASIELFVYLHLYTVSIKNTIP